MADTINVSLDAARAAYEEAGLKKEQIDKLLSGLTAARTTAGLEVVVNPEGERKYGDVSIFKVQANGYRKPKMGVFTKDIQTLIDGLTQALKELS